MPRGDRTIVRAGLYVLAPVNANECAPSSARITDVDVCRAAAPALGRTFGVSGIFVSAPRGCYVITTTGAVWFNAHATGAAAADKQLVCYTGTYAPTNVGDTNPPTRAPTFAPTRGPNFADPTGAADARVMPSSSCCLLCMLHAAGWSNAACCRLKQHVATLHVVGSACCMSQCCPLQPILLSVASGILNLIFSA